MHTTGSVFHSHLSDVIQASQQIFKVTSIIIPILPMKKPNGLVASQTKQNETNKGKRKKSLIPYNSNVYNWTQLSSGAMTRNICSEPSYEDSFQLCGL